MRSVIHFLIGFILSSLLLGTVFYAIHSRLELDALQGGIAVACLLP